MKKWILEILFFAYGGISLFILLWTTFFPFIAALEPAWRWTGWIAIPLTAVIAITQREVIQFFISEGLFW